jgi:hypothetical protein
LAGNRNKKDVCRKIGFDLSSTKVSKQLRSKVYWGHAWCYVHPASQQPSNVCDVHFITTFTGLTFTFCNW